MNDMKIEDRVRQLKPQGSNPFVAWPLRIAAFVLNKVHQGVTAARDDLKYRLAVREWYRPRPDDVFIVSYPKSGTTVMQMILYQLKTGGDMDIPHIGAVSPWFELELVRTYPQVIEATPSPRAFKSHARYGKLPRGAKYIYLVRRPEDVAVSAFHHYALTAGMAGDLGRSLDHFIADRGPFGSWFRHVASWWPHRHDANVLWLRYEEIIADLEGTIRRVAAFCGLPVDEAQMPRVLERCGVAFMKRHGDKFDPRTRQFTHLEEFVRKGKAGAGAQVLSAEQREQLERRLGELARGLGCSAGDPFADLLLGHRPDGSAPAPAAVPRP